MKLRPVRQWITVEPIEVNKVGSLWAPDSATAQYKRGRVVDIPTKPTEETEGYKPGEVVVYDAVGAIQLRINNKTFHAIKGREIVGVLEDYTEE